MCRFTPSSRACSRSGGSRGGRRSSVGRPRPTTSSCRATGGPRRLLQAPALHQDLGAAPGRLHDGGNPRPVSPRRTPDLCELALQLDGAAPAKNRLISHGPEGSVIGDYTTLPWSDLCAQVSLLRIGLRGAAEVRALPVAVGGREAGAEEKPDPPEGGGGGGGRSAGHAGARVPANQRRDSDFRVPRAGFEPAHLSAPPPQDGVSTSSTTWAKSSPPLLTPAA